MAWSGHHMIDPHDIENRFSTEDGMAYMDNALYYDNNRDMRIADDKAAIEWMLRNVPGSPVKQSTVGRWLPVQAYSPVTYVTSRCSCLKAHWRKVWPLSPR